MTLQRRYKSSLKVLTATFVLVLVAGFDRGSHFIEVVLGESGLFVDIQAANSDHTTPRLLQQVMPGADSFSEKEGEPPVYKAYRTDPASGEKVLIGYAFVTSDFPPEPSGYNGPVDTLIGMNLEGVIVGLEVIYHRESLRYIIGDFFSDEKWYVAQFLGMKATNKFAIGRNGDIDAIAGATISSGAMSRGVRQTVRAVTEAYIKK
ncbi:MAG: FMN-binding protein [Gammaproteobacteria bacterium]|nr:FMN-binding protein [Gammaproteobacteria bacterium]